MAETQQEWQARNPYWDAGAPDYPGLSRAERVRRWAIWQHDVRTRRLWLRSHLYPSPVARGFRHVGRLRIGDPRHRHRQLQCELGRWAPGCWTFTLTWISDRTSVAPLQTRSHGGRWAHGRLAVHAYLTRSPGRRAFSTEASAGATPGPLEWRHRNPEPAPR